MIVVDSSALIAILDAEPDAARYASAIAAVDGPLLSVATLVETGIVMLNRHGPRGMDKAQMLVQEAGFQVETVSSHHARLALEAYARYGKGRGAGAGLNFGDCFSYALAKAARLPLLYKGDDFSKTDVELAP